MTIEGNSYADMKARIESEPEYSFWLREALLALEKRDVVDAWRDAEILAAAARKRMDEQLAETDLKPRPR